ncbi:MAG: sulfatase [Planctomycetes bacterium]|nr:sulfatase [Planctomycetota bacterium]
MRIIYFDIDCLRPDHLGCYGYERPISPNIDRIAAGGTRLDNCYCSTSPCLPSRTAFHSGRLGIRNGVVSNHGAGANYRLRTNHYGGPCGDNMPLPRVLRQAGMDTVCISNFADRHAAYGWMCGWSEFITPNLKGGNETAEEVNAHVLRWLRQNQGRRDYLLHINYWDAHRIYKMGSEWTSRLGGTPVPQAWPDDATIRSHYESVTGRFTASGQFPGHRSPVPLMPGRIANRADFERMVDAYDASIAYVDHHLGQVVSALAADGGLEDTVIIVSADHGDAFGEHGIYTDHVCADECIHRVPMIIAWPGLARAGQADDGLVYQLDLAATLCDALGIRMPGDWDGNSFVGNLRGGNSLDRDHLVWDHALYAVQRAVRTRDHLLIRTFDDGGYAGFDPVALYDMRRDRYQTSNIAEVQPELRDRMLGLLETWTARQLSRPHAGPDPLELVLAERRAAMPRAG